MTTIPTTEDTCKCGHTKTRHGKVTLVCLTCPCTLYTQAPTTPETLNERE